MREELLEETIRQKLRDEGEVPTDEELAFIIGFIESKIVASVLNMFSAKELMNNATETIWERKYHG